MRTATLLLVTGFAFTSSSLAAPPAENWENHCASCHGADGKAQTRQGKRLNIRDYTDPTALANFSDNELTLAIADGVKDGNGRVRMQGYKDELSADEISDLLKYIRAMADRK